MGRGPEQTLFPRRRSNGQQIDEKMLNITHYKRNTHQNYDDTPPCTC